MLCYSIQVLTACFLLITRASLLCFVSTTRKLLAGQDKCQIQKLLTDSILSGSDRSAAPMPPWGNAKRNSLHYHSSTKITIKEYKKTMIVAAILLHTLPFGSSQRSKSTTQGEGSSGLSGQRPRNCSQKGLFKRLFRHWAVFIAALEWEYWKHFSALSAFQQAIARLRPSVL